MNSFEVGRGRKLGKSTIPIWQSLLLGSPFFQSTETLENTSLVLILVPFVAKAVGEEPVKLSAYPNNPAERKAIRAQAKWRKAR